MVGRTGKNWLKLKTPVSYTSFGKYITIEIGDNEVVISNTPKIGRSQDMVMTGNDNVETISKVLRAV